MKKKTEIRKLSEIILTGAKERKLESLGYSPQCIENARKELINAFYVEQSKSLGVLNLKRKCGIITSEMVDYYLHDKKTGSFNDDINSLDKYEIPKNGIFSEDLDDFNNTNNLKLSDNFANNSYQINNDSLMHHECKKCPKKLSPDVCKIVCGFNKSK